MFARRLTSAINHAALTDEATDSISEVLQDTSAAVEELSLKPSDYFRRQIHACYWFERQGLRETLTALGPDHIMFETDFPHPTCLYPDSMAAAAPGLATLRPEDRRKVLQDNAAALYRIPTA